MIIDILENFENRTLSPCFHFLCYLLRCKMQLLFIPCVLYFPIGVKVKAKLNLASKVKNAKSAKARWKMIRMRRNEKKILSSPVKI